MCTLFCLVHIIFLFFLSSGVFQKEVDETESLSEKAALYRLSLSHLEAEQGGQRDADFSALRDRIFTGMWRCRIQDRVSRQHQVGLLTDYLNFFLIYLYYSIFFNPLYYPFRKFGPPYLGETTAATRAVLPSPTSACWVFSCFRNPSNSDMDYRIFNVRT